VRHGRHQQASVHTLLPTATTNNNTKPPFTHHPGVCVTATDPTTGTPVPRVIRVKGGEGVVDDTYHEGVVTWGLYTAAQVRGRLRHRRGGFRGGFSGTGVQMHALCSPIAASGLTCPPKPNRCKPKHNGDHPLRSSSTRTSGLQSRQRTSRTTTRRHPHSRARGWGRSMRCTASRGGGGPLQRHRRLQRHRLQSANTGSARETTAALKGWIVERLVVFLYLLYSCVFGFALGNLLKHLCIRHRPPYFTFDGSVCHVNLIYPLPVCFFSLAAHGSSSSL